MIRLTVPVIEEEDLQAVRETLLSGYLVQGPQVAAFEQVVADYVGCQHAIAVSNGTAALHLALVALDINPGDMVIVTAYSWLSTANVIELCGAQPVFVDIQPDTFNLDPACLEQTLQGLMAVSATAKRVKAILPVHTFGQMADMPRILEIAKRYDIPVIEDAACALGAAYDGHQAGTLGALGCFSFHPRKAVTTGEGGMLTTNDPVLARRLQALRNHGLAPDSPYPDFIMPGFNYRMTEFQAALGQAQMAKLNRIIATRHRLAMGYDRLFATSVIQSPIVQKRCTAVYQSYVILVPDSLPYHRETLINQLKEQGVEITIGTWHMPMTTYFRTRYGYTEGAFPVTDHVFARSLTLPLHQHLSERDQIKVHDTLLAALGICNG